MAKRKTNRMAWVIAAILAVAIVSGIGVMFAPGITVSAVTVQLVPTCRWATGTEKDDDGHSPTQFFDHGFLIVVVTRPHQQ